MRRRCAFTLVELLVVIGIIAILLAIVIPALAASRRQATRVVCMSNLRQLVTAFIAYSYENRDHLPRGAPQGDPADDYMPPLPQDWIHWNWGRDIRQSAIAPYLRGFPGGVLVCPADDPDVRLRDLGKWATEGKYRYSYSMNIFMGDLMDDRPEAENRLSRIKGPCEKILLVEEDESSIDDGCWFPELASTTNLLAIRHDRGRTSADFPHGMGDWLQKIPLPDHKGNVAFCDGHVDYVPRAYAHDPTHYLPRMINR